MEWPTTTFAVLLLLLLRVVVPIAVTITFIRLLKWLDDRWKQEADVETSQLVKVGNVGCWEINNCPQENRASCKAYNNPDIPCWQVFREKNGRLQERCIGCDIFRQAPAPVSV
jgi:hypothetical protein